MYLECSRNQQSVYKDSLPSCSDSSSSNSLCSIIAFLLSLAWLLTIKFITVYLALMVNPSHPYNGYLFKLYGMPINWKATQQRSVTKSTTEAELIALSATEGEMEWWIRVFQYVKFDPEIHSRIYCNNEQTVEIVKKEDKRLHTKLRHVDTHQMWVRQEIQEGQLYLEWCPTAEMPADGLTKSLVRQKHAEFLRQLGLENVCQLLTTQVKTLEPAELRQWY
jgi:hypothetical protein